MKKIIIPLFITIFTLFAWAAPFDDFSEKELKQAPKVSKLPLDAGFVFAYTFPRLLTTREDVVLITAIAEGAKKETSIDNKVLIATYEIENKRVLISMDFKEPELEISDEYNTKDKFRIRVWDASNVETLFTISKSIISGDILKPTKTIRGRHQA